MPRYRIKLFSDFCSSTNCKKTYECLCDVDLMDNYGPDKDIYIVGEGEEYTHVILFNTPMPELLPSIKKENVIGIAYEPIEILMTYKRFPDFIEYAKTYTRNKKVNDKEQIN